MLRDCLVRSLHQENSHEEIHHWYCISRTAHRLRSIRRQAYTHADRHRQEKSSASAASAQGYVTPIRHADLAFRTSGRVTQVLVTEGDQVKTGQPLVKLQDAELKAALAQAQADQLCRTARVPKKLPPRRLNLDIAQSQLEAAQADLSRLQNGALAVQTAAAQADAARAKAE